MGRSDETERVSLLQRENECGGTLEVRTGQGVQSCSVASASPSPAQPVAAQSNPVSRIPGPRPEERRESPEGQRD